MALQASGNPISFSQISNEFGTPTGKNLGAYRVSQTVGELTRPLDDGIPTSGEIKFSDFYSKRLNMVVYCSGNRVNARSLYNSNNNVTVIGGYKTRPASSSGFKVWIHTNAKIGERNSTASRSATTINYCSLITGSGWNDNTDLRLDIGPSGVVSGGGGKGGNGGGDGAIAEVGSFGTSAIGVNYQPITITNRGTIQGGTGGGGGGGYAWARDKNSSGKTRFAVGGGGGGGGGKGIPGGARGTGGDVSNFYKTWNTARENGISGTSGSQTAGGTGGRGGYASNFAECRGGAGGDHQLEGGDGIIINAPHSNYSQPGADPGSSGYGIIITNNGTGVSISGNARIGGDVYNTGVS
jgi:hypothetical protein